MRTGATMNLPIRVEGARVFIGDAHACQGDGEVCGVAVEYPTLPPSLLMRLKSMISSGRAWKQMTSSWRLVVPDPWKMCVELPIVN